MRYILCLFCRIENSDGICCFIDSGIDLPSVEKRLHDFQSNICLCDGQFVDKCRIRLDIEVVTPLHLSNRKCFLIRFKSFSLKMKEIPVGNGNVQQSSRIFFAAMTSGTCQAARLIDVTYKSFWPNVVALS